MALAKSNFNNSERGFSMLETIFATGVLATAVVALAQMFTISVAKNNRKRRPSLHHDAGRAEDGTAARPDVRLRHDRPADHGYDDRHRAAVETPNGGTGLTPSPAGTLVHNTNGYVDYIDQFGNILGGGEGIRLKAVYIRRWSIEPLPTNPNNTIVIQVMVTRETPSWTGRSDRLHGAPGQRSPPHEHQDEKSAMTTKPRSDAGFSLLEVLIATAIMLTVTGGVFTLLNPTGGMFQAQPEVVDMQQRLRIGVDTLTRDLVMAGAGAYSGSQSGSLTGFFAPIQPSKQGSLALYDDGPGIFRPDAITIFYVPSTSSQTSISQAMPNASAELKVAAETGCPNGANLCGFTEGMSVMLYDDTGAYDTMTITQVQDNAAHLQHNQQGDLSKSYGIGTKVVQVQDHVYFLDAVKRQLMHYDGYLTATPLLDEVVGLNFEYYGEPAAPALLDGLKGQDVTYGPKPPAWRRCNNGGADGRARTARFQKVGGIQQPRLANLGAIGTGSRQVHCGPADRRPVVPERHEREQVRRRFVSHPQNPRHAPPADCQRGAARIAGRRCGRVVHVIRHGHGRAPGRRPADSIRRDAPKSELDQVNAVTTRHEHSRPSHHATSDHGVAMIVALMAMSMMVALGTALILMTTTETRITNNFRNSAESMYAADAGLERALDDMLTIPDWNNLLSGASKSALVDGAPTGTRTLHDGTTFSLDEVLNMANCQKVTACLAAEMNAVTVERPWGPNNPQWQLFAYGPLNDVLPQGGINSPFYVVVMVGDDPSENDGDPLHDGVSQANPGTGVLAMRAEAFGPRGSHKVIELTIARTDTTGARTRIHRPARPGRTESPRA